MLEDFVWAQNSLPAYLKPYWDLAKELYSQIESQEKREQALELLMLEAKEDQFNLSDEMERKAYVAQLENSSGWGDQVAYAYQSAKAGLNLEEWFLQSFEQRMAFRDLLSQILSSGQASTLDEAVAIALQANDPAVQTNYDAWKSWREAHKEYGVGFLVTYDREKTEAEISDRQGLDEYWLSQIHRAENRQDYDKALMLLDTILEADIERIRPLIPQSDLDAIAQQAEIQVQENKESIWDPILSQLKREYPDKSAEEIEALALEAFDKTVVQYRDEKISERAFEILKKRGIGEEGPFSKELRQQALGMYDQMLFQKEQSDFQQKIASMVMIQVPLILAGGWAAGLARQGFVLAARGGVTAVAGEEAAAGIMATRAFTATEAVVGTAVEGTVFHTSQSVLSTPIQGSAAFDDYLRGCALSTGMFGVLNLYKLGYAAGPNRWFQQNYATGGVEMVGGKAKLQLTPSATAARSMTELGGEAGVFLGWGTFEEYVKGGSGSLEEIPFSERYADAVLTILALRGGGRLAGWTALKIKSEMKSGENLESPSLVSRLATSHIYLLNSKDFTDLAVRMGFPEMADNYACTDKATGTIFVNSGRINAKNLIPDLEFLVQHEQVHRHIRPAEFEAFTKNTAWPTLRQRYLDQIYTPGGGKKPLSDTEIMEELIAHYRAWNSVPPETLSENAKQLRDEIAHMLQVTGLSSHSLLVTPDLLSLPLPEATVPDSKARLAATWDIKDHQGSRSNLLFPGNILRPITRNFFEIAPPTWPIWTYTDAQLRRVIDRGDKSLAWAFRELVRRGLKNPKSREYLKGINFGGKKVNLAFTMNMLEVDGNIFKLISSLLPEEEIISVKFVGDGWAGVDFSNFTLWETQFNFLFSQYARSPEEDKSAWLDTLVNVHTSLKGNKGDVWRMGTPEDSKVVMETLAKSGDERAMKILGWALGCYDYDLRDLARQLLITRFSLSPEMVNAIIELKFGYEHQDINKDEDYKWRLSSYRTADRAAQTLGQFVHPLASDALLESLEYDRSVPIAVVVALGKFPEGKAKLQYWIDQLQTAEDFKRERVIIALGAIGDPRAIKPLVSALSDSRYAKHRGLIAEALRKIGGPDVVDPLINLLRVKNWNHRIVAAEALGDVGDARAIEPLLFAMSHHNDLRPSEIAQDASCPSGTDVSKQVEWGRHDFVRIAAVALGKIPESQNYLKTYAVLLGHGDKIEKIGAILTMGNIGDRAAIPYLLKSMNDGEVNGYIYRVLDDHFGIAGELRGAIYDLRFEEGWVVRKNAAERLGALCDPVAIETLTEAASSDPFPAVREAATKALKEYGKKREGEVIHFPTHPTHKE